MTKSTSMFYDERWGVQESRRRPGNPDRIERVANAVIDRIGKSGGSSVLDVGCGNGWILDAISHKAQNAVELYGLEPSRQGVLNTSSKVPTATAMQGTLEECLEQGLLNRKFDIVTCSEVIEHVEDPREFVEQLAQVLVDGGSLVLTTPNGRFRDSYFQVTGASPQPRENWLQPSELRALLSSRFDIVTFSTFDLSYWFATHPIFHHILTKVRKVPGGWRATRAWEAAGRKYIGLYQFVVCLRR